MTKMCLIFLPLIFLCIFPYTLAARDVSNIIGDNFEETAGRGLVIRTNPAGVKVYIDGIERGETPVVFDNMLP
ncbi:MAG: PEGA domain-containing protein, partial [Treponema sp.]|nr:PEGA domain-containing protein [Treponema sp.]